MNNQFIKILDENEQVIKIYKPNKFRFYFFNLFVNFFVVLLFLSFMFVIYLFPDDGDQMPLVFLLAMVGVSLLSLLINLLFSKVAYDKRVYAYTNKRILIQGGIIGTDYKSLDLVMIGATEVKVDLIDKLVRKDTGTLKFGSQSTPANVQGIQAFIFQAIDKPYETYREIKKHIDSVK